MVNETGGMKWVRHTLTSAAAGDRGLAGQRASVKTGQAVESLGQRQWHQGSLFSAIKHDTLEDTGGPAMHYVYVLASVLWKEQIV